MKKMFYTFMVLALGATISAQVGVGTEEPRQALDINDDATTLRNNLITSLITKGNTKGMVIPIVDTVATIANPVEGTLAYDLSQHCLVVYSLNGPKLTWTEDDLEWTCVSEDTRAYTGTRTSRIEFNLGGDDAILVNNGGTDISPGLAELLSGENFNAEFETEVTYTDGTTGVAKVSVVSDLEEGANEIDLDADSGSDYDKVVNAKLVIFASYGSGLTSAEMKAARERMSNGRPTLYLSDNSDNFLRDTTHGFAISDSYTDNGDDGNYSVLDTAKTHPIISGKDIGVTVNGPVELHGQVATVHVSQISNTGYTHLLVEENDPVELGAFVSNDFPFVFCADENIFGDTGDVGTCDDGVKGSFACNVLMWLVKDGIDRKTITFDREDIIE